MCVGGVEVYLHSFLTTAAGGSKWSVSLPCPFLPEKENVVPIKKTKGWVGPRSGLNLSEGEKKN